MNVTEAVERRISVRAFKPDPVAGELLREILELAHQAPSGGNLQPWRAYALAGGGEAGVTHLLKLVEAEMRVALALTGCVRIADIGPDIIAPA